MFDFFHSLNLQAIIHFLNENPHIIGIFTYFVVFLEAMAVVGASIITPTIRSALGMRVAATQSTIDFFRPMSRSSFS